METGVGEVLRNCMRAVSQLGRGEGTCVRLTCRREPSPEESIPRLDSGTGIDSRAVAETADTLFHVALAYFINKITTANYIIPSCQLIGIINIDHINIFYCSYSLN